MTSCFTVTKQVHFGQGRGRRKVMREGHVPERISNGAIPRLSRLMAMAVHMQRLVDKGEVTDYADLARLGHVTRARVTQIMNLLHLAPDIQEDILCLPITDGSRASVSERMVRPIAAIPDWRKQRIMWEKVKGKAAL